MQLEPESCAQISSREELQNKLDELTLEDLRQRLAAQIWILDEEPEYVKELLKQKTPSVDSLCRQKDAFVLNQILIEILEAEIPSFVLQAIVSFLGVFHEDADNWHVNHEGGHHLPIRSFSNHKLTDRAMQSSLYIRIQSDGMNDPDWQNIGGKRRGHQIWMRGKKVADYIANRSYRVSRIVPVSDKYCVKRSEQFDTYGNVRESHHMLDFLKTFEKGDILVLNTCDEPHQHSYIFSGELNKRFFAKQHHLMNFRCSYALISIAEVAPIFEECHFSGKGGITGTALLD